MSRTEKFLPIILAVVGPGIAAITSSLSAEGAWYLLVLKYLQGSLSILFLWYFNKGILNSESRLKKIVGFVGFTMLLNGGLISLLLFLNFFVLEQEMRSEINLFVLAIRLSLLTTVINVLLRIFKTQKERSKLELQNLSLQAENLKFQIETLKQQINPHFLFNSLNTLLDLIEEDSNAAAQYVRSFSKLYRVVLQSTKLDFIPLEDELKFLDDYWNLLKVRFRNAIDLQLEIKEKKLDLMIPPLCLQFLIENAVKHNEATSKNPLVIEIFDEDGWLVIKNKIMPIAYPAVGEKVGLKNLQERFTLLHKPIEYGVVDEFFVVKIPVKHAE